MKLIFMETTFILFYNNHQHQKNGSSLLCRISMEPDKKSALFFSHRGEYLSAQLPFLARMVDPAMQEPQ